MEILSVRWEGVLGVFIWNKPQVSILFVLLISILYLYCPCSNPVCVWAFVCVCVCACMCVCVCACVCECVWKKTCTHIHAQWESEDQILYDKALHPLVWPRNKNCLVFLLCYNWMKSAIPGLYVFACEQFQKPRIKVEICFYDCVTQLLRRTREPFIVLRRLVGVAKQDPEDQAIKSRSWEKKDLDTSHHPIHFYSPLSVHTVHCIYATFNDQLIPN